jgi:hypothetical protein
MSTGPYIVDVTASTPCPVQYYAPGDPGTPGQPTDTHHLLVLGEPESGSMLAIRGTHDDLRQLLAQASQALSAGDPTTPTLTSRNLTLWIHSEELWHDLEAVLGQPRNGMGHFKQWASVYPKHLREPHGDLDAAVAWARANGIPFTDEHAIHHHGRTGTVDSDGYLNPAS